MALQMTWQPSLLHQKRKPGPPLGLKNLGNTCYLNSVIQCLTYTPPLANFCLKFQHSSSCNSATEKKTDCPFCILEKRIVRSLSIDSSLDTPAKINSCLKIFAEHFRFGRQEDAHEFLRYVIDACHNTCLRLKKLQQQQQRRKGGNGCGGGGGDGSTVVKEIFGGALQSQVKCLSCGTESNKVDEIMDISLDVLHSGSLEEALQKFFQPEVLDGNNKYKCDNCKKLVAARKQMSILQAPNVLVIQLKRFEGIFGGKIDKAIAFEEVLVLSSYICKASQDPHPEYNLFGTIVHSGFSPDSGHYYAYIKDAMGRWYCCNDSCVSLSTLQEVLSEKVYILFFSRTKQRPMPAKTTLASNGVRTRDCNGNDTSKSSEAVCPVKPVNRKQLINHPYEKDNSTTSKVDKVPFGPQMKPSNFGNSVTKKFPANVNVKSVIHKRESNDKNRKVTSSVCTEKIESVTNDPSVIDRNGVSQNKSVDTVDNESSQSFPLGNGNGNIISINYSEADRSVDNGTRNQMGTGKVNHHQVLQNGGVMGMGKVNNHRALQNGGVNGSSEILSSKRKLQDKDSCILLAKDAYSRAKLEELKEDLRKEASLVLRSCGWSDKVYSFMSSRKKLCAGEVDNARPIRDESKRLLIADAKLTFISQIPESLKEDLIVRLRSFSQQKQRSGP